MALAPIDLIFAALDRAPIGEEDLTPEEVAELEQRCSDLRSGRVTPIPHSEVQSTLAALLPKAG